MTTVLPRVAFLGIGIMGRGMAANIARAGYPLTVWNRTPGRTADLEALGATTAPSLAAAVEAADIVCLCVTNSQDVMDVAVGPRGILASLRAGQIVLDHSTISPQVTRDLAERTAAAGASWLDAPVTGGDVGARDGTLTIMVGGDQQAFGRVESLLHVMGRHIYRVGTSGAGQTLKLIGNLIGGVTIAGTIEGLALGLKAGLPLETMLEVLQNSSANSAFLSGSAQRLLEGNYAPGFSLANRTKDFTLALDAGRAVQAPLPVTGLVRELFAAIATDHPDLDQSGYVKLIERLAGVNF